MYFKTLVHNMKAAGDRFLSIELYTINDFDIQKLNSLTPSFCALTWFHGDLNNPRSLPAFKAAEKLRKSGTNVVMHMAGRNFKCEEAIINLNAAKEMGVKNIFAIKGGSHIIEADDSKCEFPYALQFAKFIKDNYGDTFNIGVSGYPIGHPATADPISDLPYLKEKVDTGADFVMCQAVFDAKTFRDFYKRVRALNVTVPILPGIYIINSYAQLKQLMSFCKVVPQDFLNYITEHQEDEDAVRNYGICYAADLIKSLLNDKETSAPGVHIFSFNNFDLVEAVYEKLDFAELKIARPLSLNCKKR